MKFKHKLLHQVTITGKADEKSKMLNWVYDRGYTINRCGPRVAKYHFVPDTYKVIATKQVDDGDEEANHE